MIGNLLARLVGMQFFWARPLGDFNVRLLRAIFRPIRPVKDFLHGRWLGHALHGAVTDVAVGALTLVLVFDLLGQRAAADLALVVGILSMLGAVLTGLADYSETDDEARTTATVHSTVMIIALLTYVASMALRRMDPDADRTIAIGLAIVAFLLVSLGAWIGGHVVYALGTMVNRHAWRFGSKPSWLKLDVGNLEDGVPTAAKAGTQSLVVVRQGESVYALHAQCAHAGGPLPSGRVVDGCIECPWHYSRFELATGRRRQGPTTYDQPRYDVRPADGGGWEVMRAE